MNTRLRLTMWVATKVSVLAAVGVLLTVSALEAQTMSARDAHPITTPDRYQSNFSVMAGIGYGHADFQHPGQFAGVQKISTPHYRVMLGYRPHKNVGVGIGMADIGSTAFRGVQSASGSALTEKGEIRAMSAEAYVTGHIPLTSLSCLYSRGGVGYLNVSQSSVIEGSSSKTKHSNGFSPFVGIGAEVKCLEQVGFRMGFDWYFNAGDEALTGAGSLSTAYAGFVLRFHD